MSLPLLPTDRRASDQPMCKLAEQFSPRSRNAEQSGAKKQQARGFWQRWGRRGRSPRACVQRILRQRQVLSCILVEHVRVIVVERGVEYPVDSLIYAGDRRSREIDFPEVDLAECVGANLDPLDAGSRVCQGKGEAAVSTSKRQRLGGQESGSKIVAERCGNRE